MPVEFQHEIPSSSLREYDIRGIAGDTLRVEDAYAVGRSFGELLWRKDGRTAVVGRDGRLSSPELEAALIEGLRDSGISVTQIGLGPTPLLYFAGTVGNFDGALMVTGSHNPPTHNGFKMMRNGKPFFGAQIRELGDLANRGFSTRRPRGEFHRRDFSTAYLRELLKAFGSGRGLKVVWDNGNSAAGEILKRVAAALPGEHEILYPEIDGHFPHHHPDPTVENNLQDLIRRVRETQADIGIAFDGDADRIGVVDEEGKILWGDQILLFLAGDLLQRHPGSTVIADVKASDVFVKEITRLGGKPLIWKTGHSLIKNKMTETGALLAGEMSGHIFFRENWYGFDDALYGAIRILGILSRGQEPLSVFRKKLPKSWSTPELRFPIPEEEKFTLIETLKTHLSASGASFSDVDGVRVSDKDGWWLARASNTQPIIVGRMESASPEGLERLKKRFAEYLLQAGMGDLDFSAAAEGH